MTEGAVRVLVVEDDPDDFLILRKMLLGLHPDRYQLEQASTYEEAARKLSQEGHDICILDYRLEGRNGLDFLKDVVQQGYTIPIIFLTGMESGELDMEAMRSGAADFLYKNKIDADMLERSIRYSLERHKAEQNRLRLASIVESSDDAIYLVSLEGIILSWNPGAQKIYGFAPEEASGRDLSLLVLPDRASEIPQLLRTIRQGRALANFFTIHRTRNGADLSVSLTISPVKDAQGKVIRASIIARDLSEMAKANALKDMLQHERDLLLERLQLYLEKMPMAFILTDSHFNYTYWNPAAESMFGYSFGEVEGRHGILLSPEDMATVGKEIQDAMIGGRGFGGQVLQCWRKDRTALHCEWYATPLQDEDGHFSGMMNMAIDVTERRKAEEVQAQLASILQQTTDAVLGTDLEGCIFSWNRGAETMFGYKLDEVIGQPVSILSSPDRLHESMELRAIVTQGENISNFETVRKRKDGSLVDVSVTMSPVKDSKGRIIGVSAINRDISEKKQAEESLRKHEEQLRQAEKMNAIGRLAGGVAHDFNNLLSVIGGNAEFLLGSLDKDSPSREEVEEIQKAVRRGAELAKQLLVFGQKQVSQPQPVNLNDLTAELNKMLKRLIDASVDAAIIQDKDLMPILSDPGQVQQILLNLVINARDAMPSGGHLILETKNIPLESLEKEDRPTLPLGAYVRLSVTDTGTGMSEEVQKHIFEPFFTTKAGKGTGLGLATVYGLVNKWSGHIFVHSTPGMGTTFTLYFPAMVSTEGFETKAKQIALIPVGSETILLAEDEDQVRKVLVRTLEKYGYKVIEAPNGLEALQKAWGFRDPIHLLLTDTIMPKMNGKELADELKKTRPKMKVVFASGYPKEVLSQQGVLQAGIHLIQKPFELEDLVRQVRKVLDEK